MTTHIAGVEIKDDGTMILLTNRGGHNTTIRGSYIAAGVAGDHLISVNRHGHVEDWTINNSTNVGRLENKRALDNSATGAESIQVSGPGTCTVICKNGQKHVYSNYTKVQTVSGRPPAPIPSNTPKSQEDSSSYDTAPQTVYADMPDGFLAGMGHRCKVIVDEPITGPRAKLWTNTAFAIGVLTSVLSGVLVYLAVQANNGSYGLLIAAGTIAVSVGLSYWLRHMIAKVVIRTHYGLPLVILGAMMCESLPDIGPFVLIGGLILWFWPIWPIALIAICMLGVIAMAIGRSVPDTGSRR